MALEFVPFVTPMIAPVGRTMLYFQSSEALFQPAEIFSITKSGPTATLPAPVTWKLSFARIRQPASYRRSRTCRKPLPWHCRSSEHSDCHASRTRRRRCCSASSPDRNSKPDRPTWHRPPTSLRSCNRRSWQLPHWSAQPPNRRRKGCRDFTDWRRRDCILRQPEAAAPRIAS